MRLVLAIRIFFRVLFDVNTASQVTALLGGPDKPVPAEEPDATPSPPQPHPNKAPERSEAITLLAALQRESRFLDIVKEPLEGYNDAQIGAAARDVLRDCGQVLERIFAIRPLADQDEGSPLETPRDYDAACYRLTGNVQGDPPFRGQLVHPGWQATRCALPQWSGNEESANVIAPIEMEVK
jgi:hypothetical protein